MNGLTLNTILTVLSFIGIGYSVSHTLSIQTEAAKFDPAPIVQRISQSEKDIAVNTTRIQTVQDDIKEMKDDIKTILKTLRPNDYKPAAVETTKSAPLIIKVGKNGEPLNQ